MIIPEKIKSVVEETIKEIAESIAEATARIEELKQEVEEKERELETAYKILDMDKAPEAAPETKEEKPNKKAGRPKKKKEGEEMVTPTEQRSARQVVEHNKYMKNKAKKAASENVISEPITGSLEKVNAEARAAGMSYGKYMAQEQIKKQHDEMERSRIERHMREAEKNEREGILEPN